MTSSGGQVSATMKNLSHSASFHSKEKTAPSNAGTKQLDTWLYNLRTDPYERARSSSRWQTGSEQTALH